MRILFKIILAILANGVALYAADYFVDGFTLAGGSLRLFAAVALILTALNYIPKPALKLILGPLIILTLGLGSIPVNAAILKLLDFLSPALSIQGLVPLLVATLVVSLINMVFHFATRVKP